MCWRVCGLERLSPHAQPTSTQPLFLSLYIYTHRCTPTKQHMRKNTRDRLGAQATQARRRDLCNSRPPPESVRAYCERNLLGATCSRRESARVAAAVGAGEAKLDGPPAQEQFAQK